MKILSLCIIGLSILGAVFGQLDLSGANAALAVVEDVDTPRCGLTGKTLVDLRVTKAKITDLMVKLKAYAVSIGLDIPPEEPAPEVVPAVFTNCKEILDAGYITDGVYPIIVEGYDSPVNVYCDMTTDFGGWTVFQRRLDGSVDFNRSYDEYAAGFGNLQGEFWMGNDLLSTITMATPMELRIDISDFDNDNRFAKYNTFRIEGSSMNYRLIVGGYEGDAGNSLAYHNTNAFSAFDVDNDDTTTRNCALIHNGGWWFKNCLRVNLNGIYFPEIVDVPYAQGLGWSRFRGLKYSLKFSEMKIRPVTIN